MIKTQIVDPEKSSPFNYVLKHLVVSGERIIDDIDLHAVSIEIQIFENLNNPYLTGEVSILDNENLSNKIGFVGTEKLLIEIETEMGTIRKNFVITEVLSTLSTNGNDKVFVLSILEDISFLSKLTRISKSYSGSPDHIIKTILREHLNRDMLNISPNHHGEMMKVIVPNLTPLSACSWIQRRAVTNNGMPFYLFSSLADDNIRYIDLETILTSTALNSKLTPYIYNQGISNNMLDANGQSFIISDVNQSNAHNMMMLCQLGLMSSTYTHIDTVKGVKLEKKHIMSELFEDLKSKVLKSGQKEAIIDTTNTFNNKTIQEYDTRQISRITPTSSYADNYKTYSEASDISKHMLRAKAAALLGVLNTAPIDISVPGRNFYQEKTNVSIGNTINLEFFNFLDNGDEEKDQKRSGSYIIHAARHIFSGPRYSAIIGCSRLSQKTPKRG